MKRNIKLSKGITLIALVITIIVLLILAGVSITILVGENGIIKQAIKAKNMTEKSEIAEKMKLYELEIEMRTDKTLKELLIQDGLVTDKQLEEKGIIEIYDDILVVSNFEGLKEISKNVAKGEDYHGKTIYVTNDIECGATFNSVTGELLSGENFIPIGSSNSRVEDENNPESTKKEFNGIFNGFNYTIKGLYIKKNETTDFCTALFGYIGENGEVKNLKITDSYIWGYYEIGAFAGVNRGKIINCVNEGIVVGDYHLTGGIAGRNINLIENCTNNGNVRGNNTQVGGIVANCDFGSNVVVRNCINNGKIDSTASNTGGIVGGVYNTDSKYKVTIENCKNYGSVNNETTLSTIGGIAGQIIKGNTVINCENRGKISGYTNVGGIAGYNSGNIEDCKNFVQISAEYSRVGGIVGTNYGGMVTKCSNHGYIYLPETGYYGTGGIVGDNEHTTNESIIQLCFNEGEVYNLSRNGQAGGIVGNLSIGSSSTTNLLQVINCYNNGYIHGSDEIGGIVGYMNSSTIKNCYNIRRYF